MPEDLLDLETIRGLIVAEARTGEIFVSNLLRGFTDEAHATLERMRACACVGDRERLAREAHRLKGTSGSLGAARLSDECDAIERHAFDSSREAIEARIEHALRLLDASRRCMEAHFPAR